MSNNEYFLKIPQLQQKYSVGLKYNDTSSDAIPAFENAIFQKTAGIYKAAMFID